MPPNSLTTALGAVRQHVKAGAIDPEHYKQITRALYTDPMTGMGNRLAYRDFLSRPKAGVHVRIDGNDFGDINKQHGFEAGDSAIVAIGSAIREALHETVGRKQAKSFRVGGDEVFCHLPDVQSAARFSRRVREKLESIAPVGGTHNLSLSIGLGHTPAHAEDALMRAKMAKKAAGYKPGQARTHVHSLVHGAEGAVPVDPVAKSGQTSSGEELWQGKRAAARTIGVEKRPVTRREALLGKSEEGPVQGGPATLAKMAPKKKPTTRYGYHGTDHSVLGAIAQEGLDPGYATEDEETAHYYAAGVRLTADHVRPVVLRFPYPADAHTSEDYIQRLMDEGDSEKVARGRWNHEFTHGGVRPHLIEWRHASITQEQERDLASRGEDSWQPLVPPKKSGQGPVQGGPATLAKMAPKVNLAPPVTRHVPAIRSIYKQVVGRSKRLNHCDKVSAAIAAHTGMEHVMGVYYGPEVADYEGGDGNFYHEWNHHPDGTIVDATANQFGDGDHLRIIPPGDERQAWYR